MKYTDKNLLSRPIDGLKTDEIIRCIEQYEKDSSPDTPLRVLFLRNFTLEPLAPYLKYLCCQEGIFCKLTFGDYDNILQEVVNPDGALVRAQPDIIIIGIRLEVFNPQFSDSFIGMSPEDRESSKSSFLSSVKSLIEEIRARSKAIILIQNLEVPVFTTLGILDYQKKNMKINSIREINRDLVDLISEYPGAYIIDIENLKSNLGYQNFIDTRNWYLSKTPYSQKAFRLIAQELTRFILSLRGRTKKCLVLDCDNTLWGGLIGEEGINNIQVGHDYPGSVFLEFQQSVLNLYNKGIMLAICSKNNENDVMEVFEKHPYMILKKDHFLIMKINWLDKATNLKAIADELNIGIDSMVLVDDNLFEITQVKEMVPDISVIHFEPPSGCLYKDILSRSGFFDTLAFSEEDRQRNAVYQADIVRNELKTGTKSLEEFFRDLEMEVVIRNADSFSIPRIAQMTQKTNQFNLTTKRYTESDILAYSGSTEWSVRYLELKDRFGNNGIVGLAIIHFTGDTAIIDTFLLSCRIIGRSVEDVLLADCIDIARTKGCQKITGQYIPTKKNIQVESFYPDRGFQIIKETKDATWYVRRPDTDNTEYPPYFKKIDRE